MRPACRIVHGLRLRMLWRRAFLTNSRTMVIRILPSRTGGTKGVLVYLINLPIHMTMVVTLMLLIHPLRETLTTISPLRTALQKICGALRRLLGLIRQLQWVNKMQKIMLYSIPNLTVLGIKLLVPNLSSREPLGGGASTTEILMVCRQKIRGLTAVMRTASFTLSPVPRHVL